MANPYSILHNYNQPLYSPDFNFIQTALQYKQVKLDQNRQKLQSVIDQFSTLDVYRDVDRQYVEERLEGVMSIANKYASGDLSSDSFSNSILKNITQIVDPQVKNAVLSTRRFRNEQAQWEQLREKEPDAYNDNNYAYSLQASEAWRTGEAPGEVYKGGGGVRKYVDYNKVIRENIPKLQEMLEAEWIEDAGVGAGGYFREVVTKKAVDRGRMEMALNTFIGSKEMDQMRIDAWARYSKMDENTLSQQYDDYFSPKLKASQDNVDRYEKLADQERDPAKKAEYQKLLDIEKKNVNALELNSFDNVVQTAGKEAAYTTLFSRQFKDSYLNAYSYAPIEIKREVNQLDVETKNLELKIREYDLSKTNADRDYALDLRKQELEEMKAAGNGVLGNNSLPLMGDNSAITQEQGYENQVSHVKAQQKLEADALNGMKTVLSPAFGNLSPSQLRQLGGQFQDIAGKDKLTIKIDGKTTIIDIRDPKNFKAVKDFQNYVLNDSPTKKFEQEGVLKIVGEIKRSLSQTAQGDNPDINLASMPRFGYKLVEGDRDANGKPTNYKVVPTNYGGSYYGYLLKKTNRTEADNMTLDWYVSMHLIGDQDLSREQRKSVFSTMQNKIYSKIDSEDLEKLPQNDYTVYRTVAGRYQGGGTIVSNENDKDLLRKYGVIKDETGKGIFQMQGDHIAGRGYDAEVNKLLSLAKKADRGDAEAKKEINRIKTNINKEFAVLGYKPPSKGMVALADDYYLSDMTSGDLEWSGGSVGKGFDKYISQSFKTLDESLEQRLASQNMEMSLKNMIYTPGQGKVYEDLAYSIGLPKGSKMPITVTRQLDSKGQPTGKVDWSYTGGTPSKPVVVTSQDAGTPLSNEQINRIGIKYGEGSRPQYRASYGENAPVVDLGSSKVDREVENRVRKTISADLPLDNVDLYLNEASRYGVQPVVADAIQKFDNGSYKFKLVADNGSWNRVILLNGQQIYSENLMQGDYSDDEMKNMYDRAYYDNQIVFHNYLSELIQEAQRGAKINAASQR